MYDGEYKVRLLPNTYCIRFISDMISWCSFRDSWQSKIHELLPYVSRGNIVCAKNEHDYVGDSKILITSFNLMERMNEKVVKRGYGFVIFVSISTRITSLLVAHQNNFGYFVLS